MSGRDCIWKDKSGRDKNGSDKSGGLGERREN